MKYAPVLIPTLCRYDKFKKCVESLKKNGWAKYTVIYIALDYPLRDEHWTGYNEICKYLEQDFPEFSEFHVIRRNCNYGSAKNIEEARNFIFQKYDRYIHTDDDIEFSENFLEYIDKTMEMYENDPGVIAVCGYSYPLEWAVSPNSSVFKTNVGLFMWGTGYWRDKYIPIKKEIEGGIFRREYAKRNKRLWREKLTDARYIEFLELGSSTEKGLLDCSSDISFSLFMQLYDKYAIIPVISKARNNGFDGTGEYCQKITHYSHNASNYDYSQQEIDPQKTFNLSPNTLYNDAENRKIWASFDSRKNLKSKIFVREFKYFLKKIIGVENYKKIKVAFKTIKNKI